MNEFYRPDRQDINESQDINGETITAQTAYAEPADTIKIVVDESPAVGNYSQRRCSRCGSVLEESDVFCGKCGAQAASVQQNISYNSVNQTNVYNYSAPGEGMFYESGMKNKYISLLLCFFFGYFGAHRFYEGKTGTGILWLLTLGCFGIGWIADFFILLGKPPKYKPKK